LGYAYYYTLDNIIAKRKTSLTDLSGGIDSTIVNLSILKNGKVKAMIKIYKISNGQLKL